MALEQRGQGEEDRGGVQETSHGSGALWMVSEQHLIY